jgi:phosphate transport system substrate-binding protein
VQRKFLFAVAMAAVLALVLFGCGGADQSITVAGSTSVQPVSELLAEAFMDANSGITVNVQGGGSTAGVRAAEDGAAEIGAASRNLKEEEQHLTEYVIATDGIAIVVHPSNTVRELTLEQVRMIFAHQITDWSEVGGSSADIIAVTREEGSGTRAAFEEIVMDDEAISPDAIVQNSTGACKTTVAGDSNSISYISLAALDDTVTAISVEGADPTVDNIVSGSYPVARPFLYVTKGTPSGPAKMFIDFVMSPEAQSIIEEAGLVSTR